MGKRMYRIDDYNFYDSNKSCLLIESKLEPFKIEVYGARDSH